MKSFISALGAILLWSLTALAPIDAAVGADGKLTHPAD